MAWGTCYGCGEKQPLDKRRRIVSHERILHSPTGTLHAVGTCHGSLTTSVESRESGRKSRANRKRRLIEPFRAYAAVALDAIIERREYPRLDLEILAAVGFYDYRSKSPTSRLDGLLRIEPRHNGGRPSTMADAYCAWCGVLVHQRLTIRAAYVRETRARIITDGGHVLACTLEHLAHDRMPVAPDVRRLPDEMLGGAA